jgi:primosomal protein N'
MKILLYIIASIFVSHSLAQTDSNDEKDYFTKKELELIKSTAKSLKELTFTKAVKQFGEPEEKNRIEITEEVLKALFSEEIIEKHFSNKLRPPESDYLLECNWKILSESWLTVWYKRENNKWLPIDILTNM